MTPDNVISLASHRRPTPADVDKAWAALRAHVEIGLTYPDARRNSRFMAKWRRLDHEFNEAVLAAAARLGVVHG